MRVWVVLIDQNILKDCNFMWRKLSRIFQLCNYCSVQMLIYHADTVNICRIHVTFKCLYRLHDDKSLWFRRWDELGFNLAGFCFEIKIDWMYWVHQGKIHWGSFWIAINCFDENDHIHMTNTHNHTLCVTR